MATELPADRPLWELSVVEGLADGRTALILKIHHALADGVSGAATFAGLFDISEEVREPAALPEPLEPSTSRCPTPLVLLGRTAGEMLRRPQALLEAVASGVEQAAAVVERALRPPEPRRRAVGVDLLCGEDLAQRDAEPCTSLHAPAPRPRRGEARGEAPGGDGHRLRMCTVGGALRRLLEQRGEPLERDLVAFMPVNVRREGAEGELGNRISAVLVSLHADVLDHEARIVELRDESSGAQGRRGPELEAAHEPRRGGRADAGVGRRARPSMTSSCSTSCRRLRT